MRKLVLFGLASAMVLVFVGALFADESNEYQKKIEAESGVPGVNARALDCTGAITITCGQALSGTTVGGASNVTTYNCSSYNESGPEKVYVLTTTGWNTIRATLSGMSADMDVFILSSCGENACIAYGDTYALTACVGPGTYYISVDGYNGASGTFTLTILCTTCAEPPPPPANDKCAGAIDLPCNAPFSLSGTTLYAINDYSPGVYPTSCTRFPALGKDVVYKFTVPAGSVINAAYTLTGADGSIYIITDCANPTTTCVIGEDSTVTGGVEDIENFTFASAGTYYMILDAYTSGGGGAWTCTGNIACPTAVENTSWGKVKTLYR